MNWKGLSVASIVILAACSSKSSSGTSDGGDLPEAGNCSMPGAATPGPADTHCAGPPAMVQPTTMAGCYADAASGDDSGGGGDDAASDAASGGDAAGADSGGADAAMGDDSGGGDAGDIGNCGDSRYGATMYGNSGSDDDCKYDVKWTSTPICRGMPVYFTVTATTRASGPSGPAGSPLTGANARPDVVLNCSHPIPNSPAPADPSPENPPGTYTVGPIVFDQPGKWVFRFHFWETCMDFSPESPHGHAAFYINVP
jgi:hypothetical protein